MGASDKSPILVRLEDAQKALGPFDIDLRGQKVRDGDGQVLGRVESFFIDDNQKRLRVLEVVSGGFWRTGRRRSLVPVELIDSLVADEVWLAGPHDPPRPELVYNPEIVTDPALH